MSVTRQNPTYPCSNTDCDDEFQAGGGHNGSFCSKRCYIAHKGTKAWRAIEHDHTVCGTCGRIRAETEPPKPLEQWAIDESIDGGFAMVDGDVQFLTWGQEHTHKAACGFRYSTFNEEEGACVCGTIGNTDSHDILRPVELHKILHRLFQRLQEKEREGQFDTKPDKQTFFDTYYETRDIQYATGKALYE